MRNYIFEFEQSQALDLKLSLKELLLLDYMYKFFNCDAVYRIRKNNQYYCRLTYNKVLSDLPILGIQQRQLRNMLTDLEAKGIIKRYNQSNNQIYIYVDWAKVFDTEPADYTSPADQPTDTISTNQPTDTLTSDTKAINNQPTDTLTDKSTTTAQATTNHSSDKNTDNNFTKNDYYTNHNLSTNKCDADSITNDFFNTSHTMSEVFAHALPNAETDDSLSSIDATNITAQSTANQSINNSQPNSNNNRTNINLTSNYNQLNDNNHPTDNKLLSHSQCLASADENNVDGKKLPSTTSDTANNCRGCGNELPTIVNYNIKNNNIYIDVECVRDINFSSFNSAIHQLLHQQFSEFTYSLFFYDCSVIGFRNNTLVINASKMSVIERHFQETFVNLVQEALQQLANAPAAN